MSNAAAPELSLLSTAPNGLRYLTANDWALIADKATRVRFKKGERILQAGKQPAGVYLILKGSAKVHIAAATSAPSTRTAKAKRPARSRRRSSPSRNGGVRRR